MTKNADINKSNAFKVPENYFDNFSVDIQTKLSEEKLKEKFGTVNPFTVPESYFESFSVNTSETKTLGRTIQMLKPYMAIAAGIILVFFIWQIVLTRLDNSQPITDNSDKTNVENKLTLAEIIDFSNIDSKVLENQIDNYLETYDENSIISLDNVEENSLSINIDKETAIEYFIDYSDDYNEYAELIAQL